MKYILYIKESPLGLKYLGKFDTGRKGLTVETYLGSGTRWENHIDFYGFKAQDIKTDVIAECETLEHFKIVGQYYSDLFCVVDSPEWANLKPETGDGGFPKGTNKGKKLSAEHKRKIGMSSKGRCKGKKASIETRKKMSEAQKGNLNCLGRKLSDETKARLSESKKGKISNNSKPITIDTITYPSQAAAAKALGICHSTVKKFIKELI